MRLEEFRAELREDPEYVKAELELRPFFHFADEMLRRRLARGWTQGQLAKVAGVSPHTITQIESALANPSVKTLQKIAAAFGAELTCDIEDSDERRETK